MLERQCNRSKYFSDQ